MNKLIAVMAMLGFMAAIMVVPSTIRTEASEPEAPVITADPVMRIDGDGEIAVAADFGSGTVGDPWIICDKTIIASGEKIGIFIGNVTEYWQINETAIMDVDGTPSWWWESGHGIHVYNCDHGEIFNCTVNNSNYGICVSNGSTEISIHDNVIWDCDNRGLAVIDTDDSDFSGNTIYGNTTTSIGISFDDLSDNHTVTSNIIDDVLFCGIGVNDSWWMDIWDNDIIGNMTYSEPDGWVGYPIFGLFLYNSFHWDIEDNEITNASYGVILDGDTWGSFDGMMYSNDIEDCVNGITTRNCDNVSIQYNNISTTGSYITPAGADYGIHMQDIHTDFTIHDNYIFSVDTGIYIDDYTTNTATIYDNNLHDNVANAWDGNDATQITWWNPVTAEGNWWDDWTTPDTNADGIVDTPYLIPGTGANYDSYPQCSAGTPPGGGYAPGGGGILNPILNITANETAEPEADYALGLLFWAGCGVIFAGLVNVPVPYVSRSMLITMGAMLILLNFFW